MIDSFTYFSASSIQNVLLLSAGTVNLVFSVLIYFNDRHKGKNIFFALIAVCVSVWSYAMAAFNLSSHIEIVAAAAKWLYISAAGMPFFFYYFSTTVDTGYLQLSFREKIAAFFVLLVGVVIVCIPDYVISTPTDLSHRFISFGPGYIVYACYIVFYFLVAFRVLYSKYKSTVLPLVKKQILFIYLGTFAASSIGVATNLVMPFFGQWSFFWFGPVATIIMIVFVGYSTIRHNLFNTKSVLVESVTFVLWVAMLMRFLLSSNVADITINGILFLLVVVSGLILISAIYKEIDQFEKIESIAKDLESANEHLRVLDKQKSEFVSIASHQLRTPLTAIIGYSSMLLEGTYGAMPDNQKEVLDKVYQSSRRLSSIIDDFLNISRIEQGRMKYDFSTVDMGAMLANLAEEFSPRIQTKGLYFNFITDGNERYPVTADSGKVRQILSNLLDNAMKYTLKGGIAIALSKNTLTKKTIVLVKDTGLGMTEETMGKLFQMFSRGEDVNKIYTEGSGIGLYVAKEMMKAHHGRIWAESEGLGKGSTFFIELMSEE